MSFLSRVQDFFNTPVFPSWESKSDPAYQYSVQFVNPGQPLYSDKNYGSFVKEGYKRCGTVYNCVNKISGAASGIKWKLYTDRTMNKEITSHPLLDRWNEPNPNQGMGEFVEQLFGFWHMSGNSYVWANRPGKNAPPDELWCMRPDRMRIVPSAVGIANFIYGYGSANPRIFEVPDTLHLKFPAYDDDWYGLSPIEVASNLIDQQNEGNGWNTALMQNAGKPASAFFTKGYLTPEQRDQIKTELRKKYSGKRNAGLPLVMEADMTYQQMSMSPYELDWLQSRELNTRDIAAIFDVAPELVGDSAGKTFANQKEARNALMLFNVLPKMDRVSDRLTIWLIPMYDDLKRMGAYFTYDRDDIEALVELYAAQKKAQSEVATGLWDSGQCTLRYAQKLQGMPPNKKAYLDVYKFGDVLVREEDLEEYAMQCLQKPAAPPVAVAEPMLNPPGGQPGTQPQQGGQPNNDPSTQPGKEGTQGTGKKPANGTQEPASKEPQGQGKKGKSAQVDDDEEEHTGVMVAFFLDAKSAKKLVIPDGEPAKDLHVTLAFLGDKNEKDIDAKKLKKTLASFASEAMSLEGTTGGLGRFAASDSSDNMSPVIALVNVSGLQEWRGKLVKTLEADGFEVANDFDFTPHITLAYIDADAPLPIDSVPDVDLSFDTLWLAVGDDRSSFPIGDEQHPQKSNKAKWVDPTTQSRLQDYTDRQVTHLRWVCGPNPCEFCAQNDGQVVETGTPFNNGLLLPICHDHCECGVQEIRSAQFGFAKNPVVLSHKGVAHVQADLSFDDALELLDLETTDSSQERELPQGDDDLRQSQVKRRNLYKEWMEALT